MLTELFVPNNLHDVDKQKRLQRLPAPKLFYYAISVDFSVCGINTPEALEFYMVDCFINTGGKPRNYHEVVLR